MGEQRRGTLTFNEERWKGSPGRGDRKKLQSKANYSPCRELQVVPDRALGSTWEYATQRWVGLTQAVIEAPLDKVIREG